MSASPTAAPTQSTKRPLEDPSSPSAPNDQPEAKRPALDKIVKGDNDVQKSEPEAVELPVVSSTPETKAPTNGVKTESIDGQGDTVVPDVAPQSIETTTASNREQSV